jgi:hypothetical protein
MPKICDFETCRKFANYGEIYGKPTRCKEHKEEYKLVSQLCQECNCKISCCYNFENELKPKFCNEHKKINMIDIKNKSKNCINPHCNTRAVYNYHGELKGIYCINHRLENMVNINDIKRCCQHENCKIRATFGFLNESAKFCKKHMINGMLDISNKKCEYNSCNKKPSFNYSNEKTARFCSEHKLIDMIDMIDTIHNTCCFLNCKIQPIFNYINEINGIYCFAHKKDNMLDVLNKKCNYDGCCKNKFYNFENEKTALFCSEHKTFEMINVVHKNTYCLYKDCKTRPIFNYIGEIKGIYCFNHKKDDMIDVINKKCKAGFCLGTAANVKYKGHCSSCYQHLFPNDALTFQIRSKTKEIAVRDFINSNFEGFQHNKSLWTGNCNCTHRRRLDHRKLIGNTLLCIETDENQHKNYNLKDEEIRYDDLFMLHSGKFVYIRFNPDKFKDKNGKSVNPMLYTRLPILKEEIEKQISRIENEENIELLEIIKLYYDEIKN